MSAFRGILLQKSFGGDERNFLGPLMRFVRRDVRDLIAHQKNGHGASYRRRNRLKFDFREIFGVVRFSTFATLSANSRHHCPVRSTEIRVALVSPGEAAMKLRRRQFLHLAASAVALPALPTIASAQEPVGGRA